MAEEILRLKAKLTPIGTLRGVFSQPWHLSARLSIERIIQGNTYDGPYVVDPKFVQQVLETQYKTMVDDVTVHAIEVSRVSNPSGGNTVYIGGQF